MCEALCAPAEERRQRCGSDISRRCIALASGWSIIAPRRSAKSGTFARSRIRHHQSITRARRLIPEILSHLENELSPLAREAIAELHDLFRALDRRIVIFDKKTDAAFRRWKPTPPIGCSPRAPRPRRHRDPYLPPLRFKKPAFFVTRRDRSLRLESLQTKSLRKGARFRSCGTRRATSRKPKRWSDSGHVSQQPTCLFGASFQHADSVGVPVYPVLQGGNFTFDLCLVRRIEIGIRGSIALCFCQNGSQHG